MLSLFYFGSHYSENKLLPYFDGKPWTPLKDPRNPGTAYRHTCSKGPQVECIQWEARLSPVLVSGLFTEAVLHFLIPRCLNCSYVSQSATQWQWTSTRANTRAIWLGGSIWSMFDLSGCLRIACTSSCLDYLNFFGSSLIAQAGIDL